MTSNPEEWTASADILAQHEDDLRPGSDRAGIFAGQLEQWIGSVWASMLGLETVRASDNFLDIGGQSMLAARTVYLLREVLGIHIPLGDLLLADHLASFTTTIAGRLEDQGVELDVSRLPASGGVGANQ